MKEKEILESYGSFGRFPKLLAKDIIPVVWKSDLPDLNKIEGKALPRGYGKSYGDSCLLENGTLIDTTGMNKILEWDQESGIIKAEAGIQFSELLDFLVPRGYFLPVTPGTKLVSLAGAVANDVHGKNHHVKGTFGCHVLSFELLRSDSGYLICDMDNNSDLFKATIGGLGLTGVITWVEFKCTTIFSPYFYVENEKFKNLEEFFDINKKSEKEFEYTVSWIDVNAKGKSLGRGIYNRGNHADPKIHTIPEGNPPEGMKPFPFDYPFINNFTTKVFNKLYYNQQIRKIKRGISHYNPFFYPLDGVDGWNKAYGKNGFVQYQFFVPFGKEDTAFAECMDIITNSSLSSFLVVLKTYGDVKSPGMMSFPKPGVNLAIDFRMMGNETIELVRKLDKLVLNSGGRIYPAKDSLMSADDFKIFYPQWEEFSKYIDKKLSSSFWERVIK